MVFIRNEYKYLNATTEAH